MPIGTILLKETRSIIDLIERVSALRSIFLILINNNIEVSKFNIQIRALMLYYGKRFVNFVEQVLTQHVLSEENSHFIN